MDESVTLVCLRFGFLHDTAFVCMNRPQNTDVHGALEVFRRRYRRQIIEVSLYVGMPHLLYARFYVVLQGVLNATVANNRLDDPSK